MDTFFQDIRYSFRALLAKSGFTIAAILTLALGIGANTAIFSVIDGALVRPMPYPEDERLVIVYNHYPNMLDYAGTSIPDYVDRRAQAESLEDLALYTGASFNVAQSGTPERLTGLRTTPSLFNVLRSQPMLGRAFTDEDAVEGKDKVVVLSYGAWQKFFNGDRGIVGKEVRFNSTPYTVVGVMPESFYFPVRATQVWVPFAFKPAELTDEERGNEYSETIGRLKPGATMTQLNAQMDAIVQRNADRLAGGGERAQGFSKFLRAGNFTGRSKTLRDHAVGDLKQTLFLLQAATLFVLLIACANVANLMLTRVSGRSRELSVRTAMGAGRWRIARQLLTESMLLSTSGALLGVLLAYWGQQALAASLGFDVVNGRFDFELDGKVLAFSLLLALVTGALFGLAPVLSLWHARPYEVLKEGGRSGGGGRSARATRNGLVVVQMALAVMLLIGAGLLLKSFARLSQVQPGFNSEGVLTANLVIPESKYKDDADKARFYERVLAEARTIPGVSTAGLITGLPFSNRGGTASYQIEGQPEIEGQPGPHGHMRVVDEDYLAALKIPLLQGRGFAPTDEASAPKVVLIDEYLAKKYFANESPIGKRITNDDAKDPEAKWYTIVGVVGTVKHRDLAAEVNKETYYFYYKQRPINQGVLTLRSALPTGSLVEPLRAALNRVDPEQPMFDIKTLDERIRMSLADRRAPMQMLLGVRGLALLLSAIGIYGVLAFAVSNRIGELGVRMAIGAGRGDILKLVLHQGARLSLLGIAIGVLAALAGGQVLAARLFGVSATDPVTYLAVVALLGLTAFLACYLPARRAAATNPIVALRHE
jgi:predicted permease